MIIFTIVGIIVAGLILISFLMGLAGQSATPLLNAIDRATGISNEHEFEISAKELLEDLQPKINNAIINLEDVNKWNEITENSILLAKLILYSEKLKVKMSAEEAGKFYLAKTFSELVNRDDMKINHEQKIKAVSLFIEGNFRDSIKMDFILKNAREMCENYVRQYAQAAYKNQSIDTI